MPATSTIGLPSTPSLRGDRRKHVARHLGNGPPGNHRQQQLAGQLAPPGILQATVRDLQRAGGAPLQPVPHERLIGTLPASGAQPVDLRRHRVRWPQSYGQTHNERHPGQGHTEDERHSGQDAGKPAESHREDRARRRQADRNLFLPTQQQKSHSSSMAIYRVVVPVLAWVPHRRRWRARRVFTRVSRPAVRRPGGWNGTSAADSR